MFLFVWTLIVHKNLRLGKTKTKNTKKKYKKSKKHKKGELCTYWFIFKCLHSM